jgi:hypothetical protein
MLLYTIIMFLRFDCRFFIIRDYIVTLEYTLTNVDYNRVSSLIDDHIVCDIYY